MAGLPASNRLFQTAELAQHEFSAILPFCTANDCLSASRQLHKK
jgi:hypothetical protein